MSAEAWPRRVVVGPARDRFSRALAAFVDFVLPQLEALLGAARGTDLPPAHELALADAYAIVAEFAQADDVVTEEEVRTVLELRGIPSAGREEALDVLARWRAGAGETSPALAACAFRDLMDGGVRGPRYVRLAAALAEATCALDGIADGERTGLRAFEERLDADLSSAQRRARAGALHVGLPSAEPAPSGPEAPVPEPAESVEDALVALNRLIGLDQVKEQVRTLTNLLRVRRRRQELGLPVPDVSHHLVFVGPPGTGKTTVARLLGRIYRALGVLEHGGVHEVGREDLVGGYLGETAIKCDRVVTEALGGILFVDEAYTLAPRNAQDSFGAEAVATLVKRMEDDRERFVLIVAGYPDEMRRFLDSNPGLRSRFSGTIEFPDYDPDELCRILDLFVEDAGYRLTAQARERVEALIRERWEARGRDFGNARMVRNLFEDMLGAHANRLGAEAGAADAERLSVIQADDVTAAAAGR